MFLWAPGGKMKGRWFSEGWRGGRKKKKKVDRGRLPEEIKLKRTEFWIFFLCQQRLSSQLHNWRNHVAYLVVHSFAVWTYLQSATQLLNKRTNSGEECLSAQAQIVIANIGIQIKQHRDGNKKNTIFFFFLITMGHGSGCFWACESNSPTSNSTEMMNNVNLN